MNNDLQNRASNAALGALIVLQVVMLGALFARTAPHPPLTTPQFAIAPFLAASLAAATAAMFLGCQSRAGRFLGIVATIGAAVSFGPQKYFDAQFALIWPAVVAGQLAILGVLAVTFKPMHKQAH